MRILADQDVYAVTVAFLRQSGHDVVTALERGLSQASDAELLKKSVDDQRILLTRDRDYGSLIFVNQLSGGVIYLRVSPPTLSAVHDELVHVLAQYDEQELLDSFVVVEPARHRVRRKS